MLTKLILETYNVSIETWEFQSAEWQGVEEKDGLAYLQGAVPYGAIPNMRTDSVHDAITKFKAWFQTETEQADLDDSYSGFCTVTIVGIETKTTQQFVIERRWNKRTQKYDIYG